MVILFWMYYKTEKKNRRTERKEFEKEIFLFYSTHKKLENKK